MFLVKTYTSKMCFSETLTFMSKAKDLLCYKLTSPTPAWSTFRPVSDSRKFFSATAQNNSKEMSGYQSELNYFMKH